MIDGLGGPPPSPFTTRTVAAGSGAAATPSGPVRRVAPVTDGVSAGAAAGRLVADLAAAPPVDTVRVAALREAIAAGRYAIDPDAIAAAMLRLDRGRP